MQHMPGRAEKRMVRWAERKVGTKFYRRPISTACKHSEGCRCEQICSLNKKSQYRCCRDLVTPSRAATVGTSKETVDHGRGMAAASLLAVVCCSTKCWYQRSRTSRTAAAAFGFAFGSAFGFAFGVAFGNTAYASSAYLGVLSYA